MFRILCVSIIVFHTGGRRNEQVRRPRALFRARVPPCPVFFLLYFSVSTAYIFVDERAEDVKSAGGVENGPLPPRHYPIFFLFYVMIITDRTLESASARREAEWNLRAKKRHGRTTILLFSFYLRIYYVTRVLLRSLLFVETHYIIFTEYIQMEGGETKRTRVN